MCHSHFTFNLSCVFLSWPFIYLSTREKSVNYHIWSRSMQTYAVSIQGPHPSKAACVTAVQSLSHFEGSFKCGREMQPSFTKFGGSKCWTLRCPAYPKIHCMSGMIGFFPKRQYGVPEPNGSRRLHF